MFGSANSVSDGPTCASLELLLQAADIISKREQAGEPVAERVVPNDRYALTSESSDNGSDSDNGAVPSRASQNKPYKRPATSKRKHQQSKKLALAERLDKSDAQLKGAAMHNEVEKRRRAYLSHCYSALKLAVPGLEKSKASNVTVLRSAVDEIKKLEETGRQLEAAKAEQYRLRESLLKALPVRLPSRRASFLSLSLSLSLSGALSGALSLSVLSPPLRPGHTHALKAVARKGLAIYTGLPCRQVLSVRVGASCSGWRASAITSQYMFPLPASPPGPLPAPIPYHTPAPLGGVRRLGGHGCRPRLGGPAHQRQRAGHDHVQHLCVLHGAAASPTHQRKQLCAR